MNTQDSHQPVQLPQPALPKLEAFNRRALRRLRALKRKLNTRHKHTIALIDRELTNLTKAA